MRNPRKLLLLGGILPVLHLVRRLQDVKVQNITIIAHNRDIINYSKFGNIISYDSEVECINCINTWIDNNVEDKEQWHVIPCSETFIEYIHIFRDKDFNVFALQQDALNTFTNKKVFYTWLRSRDIETGNFYDLNNDLTFNKNETYITKVSKTSSDHKSIFKTSIIHSEGDLLELREKIPVQYYDNYIIQQMYPSTESISYGGIWLDGKELSSIIVKQLRQYPKGVTSSATIHQDEIDVEYIRNVITRLSQEFTLHGFIELEFIKYKESLIPIDLNPRLWGWSNFLFYNYPESVKSIAEMKYRDLKSKNIHSWSNFWRDVPAILKKDYSNLKKMHSIYLLLRTERIDFIYCKDPKPEVISTLKRTVK